MEWRNKMSILRNLPRILILFGFSFAFITPPLHFLDLEPGSGVILLTLMSSPSTVCLGESAPIQIFIQDVVNGILPGLTNIRMTSRLGASEDVFTVVLGGWITLNYKPVYEGSDTIEIFAFNPYSSPATLSLPVHVGRCGWDWKLTYSGIYPNPKGFWTFYEDASVGNGTLQVESTGSKRQLSGEGKVDFSVDMNGSDPSSVICALDQTPQGSTAVHVTGSLDQPGPGSMVLNFSFDPAQVSGGSQFQCQVLGQAVTVPFPFPSATVDLNALALKEVILPTGSGSYSQPVTTAVVWLLPGSGSIELSLRRLSP
jgi:hypothetical protein